MTEAEMYEAVITNDENYDGVFFYGVRSTGIFCRPSCQSKKPLAENVRFFKTAADARAAGFRPCKRCRSDLWSYRPMKEIAELVKRRLEDLYKQKSRWNRGLGELGLSQRRVVEVFRTAYGVTPKVYMDDLKLQEAKRLLTETGDQVIDIGAAAGFGSLAAFNRFFKEQMGCSPGQYRKNHRRIEP